MRLDPTPAEWGDDPFWRMDQATEEEAFVRGMFGCVPPAGVAQAIAVIEQPVTIHDPDADIDF